MGLLVVAPRVAPPFVAGITESSESKALIHTFVELGSALGLTTIAEGIEQPAQLDHLRTERCDKGQGFLFAQPLSSDELGSVLDERRRKQSGQAQDRERAPRLLRPQSRPLEA